ncbi:hypothetical protein ZIOFF_029271 [Zingiber officinale]|uniref:Transmembrane protein n=1 Tax=Zingiber officinale TaxID=94328 RepID=A0A8J5LAN1_ZINOF|nr:hypothetical protein ZIOFF_029271 [Zingiber officinale]
MDTAKSNRDMCCASIAFIYLVSLGQFIQTNSNPVNGVMTDPKRGRRVQIEEKKKDRSMVTGGWFRKLSVGGSGHRRPWKLLGLAASWRWKRPALFRSSLLDDLLFNVLYCVEGVVLVGALCLFYLCCGCHI